jgi:hypothetical protein
MLRFLWWEANLMIKGWSLTLCEVLISPFMRNSMSFNHRMDQRWDRLEDEMAHYTIEAQQLHNELEERWRIHD